MKTAPDSTVIDAGGVYNFHSGAAHGTPGRRLVH